jgi:hypothetical protein
MRMLRNPPSDRGARFLLFVSAVLVCAAAAHAAGQRSYDLSCHHRGGATQQVQYQMEVGGDLIIPSDDQSRKVPMSVVAKVHYDEKWLDAGRSPDGPLRSVRYYDQASAVVKVDKGGVRPTLRKGLRLIGVASDGGRTTMFGVKGPLTREEADLIDMPVDSLIVDQLLPERAVAVGQSWQHSTQVVAALLGLDAVSQCDVQSVLGEVTDKVAKIAIAGTIQGAVDGVGTEMQVKGVYYFDRAHRGITRFDLAVKEIRAIGHVGPGLDVVMKLKLQLTPTTASARLDAETLPQQNPLRPNRRALLYVAQRRGGYRLTYDHRWYITADEPKLAVFRLVDRGELVAQCRVSPVADQSPDRSITLAQYQKDIRYALADHKSEIVQATEWSDARGSQVFRVRAQGQVKKLPIEWRYYLVTDTSGRRVALAFTVEGSLAKRLGDADRTMVDSVVFEPPDADGSVETATRNATGRN